MDTIHIDSIYSSYLVIWLDLTHSCSQAGPCLDDRIGIPNHSGHWQACRVVCNSSLGEFSRFQTSHSQSQLRLETCKVLCRLETSAGDPLEFGMTPSDPPQLGLATPIAPESSREPDA